MSQLHRIFCRNTLLVASLTSLLCISQASAYERIVSSAGNASEIIYELGLVDNIVAVDTTSTIPKQIMEKKPKIGYRRILSSEGILSMAPDLLILAPDAGPPAVVEQLKAAKLNSITISNEKTLDGVVEDISLIAKTLKAEDKAKPMVKKIRDDEKAINTMIKNYPRTPKIAFFMDGGIGRFMGLGRGTAGDGMIKIVGGHNVFADKFKSVKPLSLESLATSDTDMIIIASHGGKKEDSAALTKALKRYPKLAVTKAGQKGCVFTIGIVEALGFGPNLTDSAKEIASAVQGCLAQ